MRGPLHTTGILVLLAALTGCSVLPPTSAPAKKLILDTLPAAVPQRTTSTSTLMLFMPQTRPLYDTMRMAYTVKPYQIDFYSQHEWGETPAQMLQPLLLKTMEGTHAFGAVLSPALHAPYSYALQTEISELVQDYTVEPAQLRLSLRLCLIDGATGRPIAMQQFVQREPLHSKGPEAGVAAANAAVARALREIAGFVLDHTR